MCACGIEGIRRLKGLWRYDILLLRTLLSPRHFRFECGIEATVGSTCNRKKKNLIRQTDVGFASRCEALISRLASKSFKPSTTWITFCARLSDETIKKRRQASEQMKSKKALKPSMELKNVGNDSHGSNAEVIKFHPPRWGTRSAEKFRFCASCNYSGRSIRVKTESSCFNRRYASKCWLDNGALESLLSCFLI